MLRSFDGYLLIFWWLCSGLSMVIFWSFDGYVQVFRWLSPDRSMVMFRFFGGYLQVFRWFCSGLSIVMLSSFDGYLQVLFNGYVQTFDGSVQVFRGLRCGFSMVFPFRSFDSYVQVFWWERVDFVTREAKTKTSTALSSMSQDKGWNTIYLWEFLDIDRDFLGLVALLHQDCEQWQTQSFISCIVITWSIW